MEERIPDRPVVAVLHSPEDPPPGLDRLESEAELRPATDAAELSRALRDADVALVTDFRSGGLEKAWPQAGRLQWVHAASAGVDALLFRGLVESPVTVTNARGVFDEAIAEYVLGAVLAFAKDLPHSVRLQDARRWLHRDTERIAGRRLLVVGAGSIGRAVARLAAAAGLAVSGVARRAREADPDFEAVYGADGLHEALGGADFVVLAAPLTAETHHLFGAGAFAAMRPGARIVNVGRGAVVDTEALVAALAAGRIAGAALDVFEDEPLAPEHPLWDFPQVLITAHMAGDFVGWREALTAQFADNFARWRAGEPLLNVVDKRRGYGTRDGPKEANRD